MALVLKLQEMDTVVYSQLVDNSGLEVYVASESEFLNDVEELKEDNDIIIIE